MKKLYLIAFALLLGMNSYAQAGTTISYADNSIAVTLVFVNTVGGKHNYAHNGAGIHLRYSGTRWEISYSVTFMPTAYYSTKNTTSNPPNFTAGAWVDADPTDHTTMSSLAGSGTTSTISNAISSFAVTGTGAYCTGGTGVAVGLADSETGVKYQLKNGAANIGLSVDGTGSAISFGNQTTAATYTVDATRTADGSTATMTGSAVVTINSLPIVSIAVTNNCGNSVLNLTTTGTSFAWSNGATTEDITVSMFGFYASYTVTVTNSAGCTAVTTAIAQRETVPTASIAVTNNCGSSVLNLTTTGTSFLWSNAATTEDITVSTSGTYTVTVTGSNSCTAVISGIAAPKTVPTASIATTNTCGSSVLNLTTTGTSFLWSNAATTEDITVSTSGTYTVTATNSATCTATANATSAPIVPRGIIYVNIDASTGSDDGTSWANAYRGSNALQKALDVACISDEIRVAAGTYKPTAYPTGCTGCSSNRDYTFHVKDGVKIYGGYNGSTGVRNIAANETTLSGDFNGNDVVTGSGATLSFSGNTENAYHVVLSVNDGGDTVLDGFTVKGGNASITTKINVEGQEIYRYEGGGIYNRYSNLSVSKCIFVNSDAIYYAGGFYNYYSSPMLDNCIITNNSAASYGGGGIYNYYSNPILNNCIISNNNTLAKGGGLLNHSSSTTLNSCVLINNNATGNGGGLSNEYTSASVLKNCIIWGNTGGGTQGFYNNLSSLSVTYSIVQGASIYPGTGNNKADPNFVNIADPNGADDIWRTADDGLRLSCGSSAFNTGTNTATPATDILGNAMFGVNKDIGAYESQIDLSIPTASIAVTNTCGSSVLNLTTTGTSFLWSNAATTEDITVSTSGTYTVTVTSGAGCTATATATAAPKTIPTLFNVTGGGTYCIGGTGVAIGLSNSENGVSYQLKKDGVDVSTAVGTGSAISFANQMAIGTYTVVATRTSGGCTATMSGNAVITTDNILPIVVTQNITVNLSASGTATITASQINNGSTDNCSISSMTVTPNTFTCSNVGANIVTFSATDANGNSATGTATVTIIDDILPTILTQNITVNLSASGTATITASQINNGSTDNCSISSMTVTPNTFTCSNVGANIVTFSATDANGNSATGTAIVTIVDNVLPTIVTQNISVNLSASGTATITASQINNGSTDNCSISSMTVTPNTFTCSNVGANIVTFSATDASGNSATGTAIVTIVDNILPTIVTQNITVNLSASGTATITASQIDNGSTDNCSISSMTVTPNTFTCSNVGANIVTFSATDASGNSATGTAIVTINYALPTFNAATVPSNATVNCSAVPSAAIVRASSPCTTVTLNEVTTKGTDLAQCNFYTYNITRTWTATDNRGNTATVRQLITVRDNVAPVITPAVGVTVTESTFAALPTTVPVTDCSAVNISFTDVKVAATPLTCYTYRYNITRTWVASDVCGNTATKAQFIVSQGVILTCPTNKTLNTNADGTADYNCSTIVKASDNVSPAFLDNCNLSILKYTLSGATVGTGNGTIAGLSFNKGITTVSYGVQLTNTDACTFTVTVVDSEAPKFGTVTNPIVDACNFPNPITMTAPIATDNCSGTISVTPSIDVTATVSGCASKTAMLKYTKSVTRTWTATDASGNTSSMVQKMNLRDMLAPTAICKDLTVNISSSNVSVLATQINNGSNDNCTATAALSYAICRNIGIVCSYASGISLTPSMIPVGSNFVNLPVTLRVTDACGNIGTCNATIRLQRVSTLTNGNTNDNNTTDLSITSDSKEVLGATPTTPSTIDATHGSLKCFPNPFSDNLNLEYNLAKAASKVTLKVYDNQGRLVTLSEQGEQLEGYYQVRWNLADLQPAMYHICLEIDGICTKMERVILLR